MGLPLSEMKIVDWLLQMEIDSSDELNSYNQWKKKFTELADGFESTIDRAITGGFIADRLAWCFAGGYEQAIRHLIKGLPDASTLSLCITEEGGGHPRAINSSLKEDEKKAGQWIVNGKKKFVTLAREADKLLIAVSQGVSSKNRNSIKMVLVDKFKPGITVNPMSDLPFVPEVSHGVLDLVNVEVNDEDILPGDGYAAYIRPFRTVEDIYIFSSLAAYLFRISRLYNWPHETREQIILFIISVRTLSSWDANSPVLHIAIGGLHQTLEKILKDIDPLWETVSPEERERWTRDNKLLEVAGNARSKRLETAWKKYQ